jgi:hypothetical protein
VKTLCIVPCGKAKIWDKYPKAGPKKTKDVYTGPFARKCRNYALTFYPKTWRILSAKYGFLKPDDFIQGPYNVSFNDRKTTSVSIDELIRQSKKSQLGKFRKIVVLGGKHYIAMMEKVFGHERISAPFLAAGELDS